MLGRFEGVSGRRLRVEALISQKLVGGDRSLAETLADIVELFEVIPGKIIIDQGGSDNDLYMILSGSFDIVVNGRTIASRQTNDHVGEMSAIEPSQKRSATVIATDDSVVAKLSEPSLVDVASRHPDIYRNIARELARRQLQRNRFVTSTREKIHVFIISSAESLEIARRVQNSFAHDAFTTTVWTDGVFKVAGYALPSLVQAIDRSDFAIAIAHADDLTESRGKDWPAPRDNVIFELGLFMGRLGAERAILMEPRDAGVKLPSDLLGITTVPYIFEKGPDSVAKMAPACNALREHIIAHGPNN